MDDIFLILEEYKDLTVGELAHKAEKELPDKWNAYVKTRDEKGVSHPDTDKAGADYARTKKIVDLKLPKSGKKTVGELAQLAKNVIQKRKEEQLSAYKASPKGEDGYTVKGTPERKKWEGKTARVFRAEDIAKLGEDFGAMGGIDTSTAVFGEQPNVLAGQENPSKIASRSKKGTQKKAMRNYKYSKLRGKKVDNINEDIDMKNIVKVMLQEGIDEETIHECLNIIDENYEVSEGIIKNIKNGIKNTANNVKNYIKKEVAFHKLAKKAPETDRGQVINTNKDIIRDAEKNAKYLNKKGARYKKRGDMKGFNIAASQYMQQKARANDALKNVARVEGEISNFATSQGMSMKDNRRFTDAFTNKKNKNVVKTTYSKIK